MLDSLLIIFCYDNIETLLDSLIIIFFYQSTLIYISCDNVLKKSLIDYQKKEIIDSTINDNILLYYIYSREPQKKKKNHSQLTKTTQK